jgi:phage terminase Nu1 subunit (DNA packaging protein)
MKRKTYSPHHLSGEFQLDRQTVVRVLRDVEPDEVRAGHGTYSTATFSRALELHRATNVSNNNDGADGDSESPTASLTMARLRVANANAEARERSNAIARDAYVPVEEAANIYEAMILTIREVLLGVPGKISDKLSFHAEQDRTQCHEIIRQEIYAALTTLADPETYVASLTKRTQSEPGIEESST